MGCKESCGKPGCRKRPDRKFPECCATKGPLQTRGAKPGAKRGHDESAYGGGITKGGQTHAVRRGGQADEDRIRLCERESGSIAPRRTSYSYAPRIRRHMNKPSMPPAMWCGR